MSFRNTVLALLFPTAFNLLPMPAMANELPKSRTVTYSIRKDTGNPDSPLKWSVSVHLVAIATEDHAVRWQIDHVWLSKIGSDGRIETTWEAADPTVGTEDGDWLVVHNNVSNPAPDEFKNCPPIIANCLSTDGKYPSLQVGWNSADFEGLTLADYNFKFAGAAHPVDSGGDEPVDTPDDTEDPQ